MLPPTPVRRVELLVTLEGDLGARVQEVQDGGTLESGTLSEAYDLVREPHLPEH